MHVDKFSSAENVRSMVTANSNSQFFRASHSSSRTLGWQGRSHTLEELLFSLEGFDDGVSNRDLIVFTTDEERQKQWSVTKEDEEVDSEEALEKISVEACGVAD